MNKKLELNFTKKPEMVFQFDQFLNVEEAIEKFLNNKENLEKIVAPYIPNGIEETIKDLIPKVEDGYTPIKGVDYNDGEPGYTPKKGVDYFDGKDGETPSDEKIISLIEPLIPEPIPGNDGKTPKKGVDYFTKKELEDIKKGLKEAIMSEMTNHVTKEEVNIKLEEIKKQVNKLPTTGGAQFLRQLMDVNVGVPTAQQYGLTYNPQRSEFSLTAITGGGSVETVTGLNTDNTDPANPIVQISVDGVTVTGAGTPGDPLVAVGDGTGDVHGPASSTDNAIARYDSTTGKIIQNSGITIADGATGTLSGTNTGDQTSIVGITGTLSEFNTALTGADFATGGGTVTGASSGTNTGDQTITNSSDATSHTVTLSASGGSVQLIEGSNITLTTGGTASAGTVTIAATGGGGVPTQITVANEAADTTCFPSFFTAATGDLGPKTNTGLTYNSSTNALAATTFTGALSGNATTATALATGRTIGTLTGDVTSTGSSFDGTGNNTNSTTVTKINGTSLAGLATGILKNTTATGVPSIAVAGDFPTLNQNTTGSAATLTTPRAIYGNNFDGSAALTQVIASTYGGTGNGFTKISGPTTTEKTITIPDANMTITAAAATVLDDTTVAAMVDTLGGAASTGTGGIARATSPTFVTPALGTPSALVATNATGTATGLTSGITNALKSATTTVDVSAATAPTSGQVLTATSGTTATWQTPTGGAGWVTIGTGTLASANATLMDVTSISSTYDTFRITICWLNVSGSSRDIWLRFNNDSGGNYATESTSFSSSTITASRESSQTKIRLNVGQTVATSSTNHYTITVSKPTTGMPASINFDGKINNTSSVIKMFGSADWNNTSAKIDRIKIQDEDGTGVFDTGSFYILEGYVVA